MIDDNRINEALDRIARTTDGEVLYAFLQRTLMGVLVEHTPVEGALRTDHGVRRFASELMAKMRKGIEESVGSSSRSGSGQRGERLIVFASSKPSSAGRHVSARDYLRDHDPELKRIAAGDGAGE